MIFIYMKRLLKHFGIVVLLISIPALAVVFRGFAEKNTGTHVGICGAEKVLMQTLCQTDGYIIFDEYTDADKMKNDVETQRLECGFVFPENMENITDVKIICGSGYTSVLSDVTKEAVFAAILKIYGRDIAFRFTQKNELGISEERFTEVYNNYLSQIKNAIAFEETDKTDKKSSESKNMTECVTAIIIACAGLIGTSFRIRDRKKGIYTDVYGSVLASVLLFDAAAVIAFVIMGYCPDILCFVLYSFIICGLCLPVPLLFGDERIPWMLMPLCAAFVVVFDMLNAAEILPLLRVLGYLLPSHCYVSGNIIMLAVWAAAAAGISMLCTQVKDIKRLRL